MPINEAIPAEFTAAWLMHRTNQDTVKPGQVRPMGIFRASFTADFMLFRNTRQLTNPGKTVSSLLQSGPEIADCRFADRIGAQPTHAGGPADRNDIRCDGLQLRQIVEFQAAGEREKEAPCM